jgi:hypothetical protein
MFNAVSWSQYFLFLLLATLLYYLFIWIVVFKCTIPSLRLLPALQSPTLYGEDAPDEMLVTAQQLMDELRPVFAGRSNQQELLLALQLILKRYPSPDDPDFRNAINAFIEQESQHQCSIRLREDDLRALWIQT